MKYYPDIKKNELMPSSATWVDLEIIILSEVSPTKTDIIMVFVFVWVISLPMIISKSIHVAANGIISFFFVPE